MKKYTILLATLFVFVISPAQVGIGTTTPQSQLDIPASSESNPANTDGILIPRINAFPVVNPTAAQHGMLVFLKTASGSNAPGVYYWDNPTTSWKGVGNGTKGWELLGNAATNPATNFIGTTDNQGLAIRTNNTERMRIDNNGLTGIGTTAPKNKLHVVGTSTGLTPNAFSTAVFENAPYSYVSVNSNSETGVIFGTATEATSGAITYNNPGFLNGMSFRTNGNITRMNLANNGNLALGAFVPEYPLHFPTTNGDKISLWGGAGVHTGFGVQLNLFQMYTGYATDDIAFGYGQSSAFTETMRIKNTGKVGIGTSAPQSKLHVYGGASGLTPNPTSPLVVEGNGFTYVNVLSNSETGILFGSNGTGTNGGVVYNSGLFTNGLNLRTGGNVNRMSITSGGNVAIGSHVPDALLHMTATNSAAPANTDGVIIPRISTFPAVNPAAAQNGMMVYLTTTAGGKAPGFYYWENASTSWKGVGTSSGWSLTGNAGTSAATNFFGTTDNQDVVFKRNNGIAGRLGATNTAFGANSMASVNGGLDNIAIGLNALTSNVAGSYNVGIGANALYHNTASGIVGVGQSTLAENTTGAFNTAVGFAAAQNNSTASYVTALGFNALKSNNASYNTAVGVNALYTNQTGEWNVAIGVETMKSNLSGLANTAIGDRAMLDNTDGQQNTAVGHQALLNNETGDYNTTVGINSMYTNQSGVSNTAFGTGALYWHASGDANTAIGMQAMNQQTSGSYNTALGVNANVPDLSGNYQLSIGNVIYGTGMNTTASAKIGIADSAPDAKLEITASNAAAPANTDGILIPRVNTFPVVNPTAAQNGMMVYLTTQIGVYQTGFYYWDNAAVSWLAVGSKTSWNSFGNAGTNPATSFVGSTDNVAVAFRSNNTERMRIASTGEVGIGTTAPTAELEVNGYTKLGGTAPAIKIIKLTGTTASSMGGSVSIATGVTGSKILEVSALVEYTSGNWVPQSYLANTGYEYNWYISGSSIVIFNKSGNSANILSKPVKLMVTYEE